MNWRSYHVMRERIHHELALICEDSRAKMESQARSTSPAPPTPQDTARVLSFVEFSCALLYFGLVPDLNATWSGDREITLLWHSWTMLAQETTATGERAITPQTLEKLLFAVILHERVKERNLPPSVLELLQIFRVNYQSRNRVSHIRSQPTSTNATDRPRSKRPPLSKTYSLHGKPLPADSPLVDPLSERTRRANERVLSMRKLKESQELAECTFHPSVLHRSANRSNQSDHDLATERHHRGGGVVRPKATRAAYERLYTDAAARQELIVEKYARAKAQRDEQERQDLAVSATYVDGKTVDERLALLRASLAHNAVPVDFHKQVSRMRAATASIAQKRDEDARRLLPTHFPRSRDGRTIVVPFALSTARRRGAGQTVISPALMKYLRPAATQLNMPWAQQVAGGLSQAAEQREEEEATATTATSAGHHEESREAMYAAQNRAGGAADLLIDVHVAPTVTLPLYVRAGDDPHAAARVFAAEHSLGSAQQLQLAQLIVRELRRCRLDS